MPERPMEPAPPSARLRFAPSPTGRLHLGHALSALINFDMARKFGGKLLIRIEDTDFSRCRPEFVDAILDDLAWLGIRSDEPVLRQSEHLPVYEAAIARLKDLGLVYPCFATRQEIMAAARPGEVDPDGAPIYRGLWRGRAAQEVEDMTSRGTPWALRLDMTKAIALLSRRSDGLPLSFAELNNDLEPREVEARPERWGDIVIRRKEGAASYHLAVVVDDARQGITHVVRGKDLLASTDVHRLLQVLLALPAPLYHHHRLILADDGRKLSKRAGDTSLETLRARGLSPAEIRRLVGL